jgi:cold shock CspA family protein
MTGRILSYWPDRAYGFAQSEDGKDFFFHKTDLPPGSPNPLKDQLVTFDVGISPRNQKEKAFNVRPLTPADILGGGAS